MFNPNIEFYIDFIFEHFKYICAFFFIGTGLWKLLRKNKMRQESEELIAQIPKEDDWVINLIKLIDKGIIFFTIPAIIVGIYILLSINQDTQQNHIGIYKFFMWYTFIGFCVNCGFPTIFGTGRSASFGMLSLFKIEIKQWYSEHEYMSMSQWVKIQKLEYYNVDDLIKWLKYFKKTVPITMIGKSIFYSGIIILCFL